ncbi:hypothetical protein P3W45_000675 [Vairimorpha bombi]|jgi:dishevelled associated activator of morphogenesis
MSNKSIENVNSQFITVLKSLNIDDSKQHKLSINLDLKKKIKTIISIQSLEERKSNIPKYLSNSKSYISLLSLAISLTTKTLFTVFINNNGSDIIKKVMEEEEGEKVSLCIEFVYRMILTYGMEFDTNFLISKAVEYEKWEVLEILDDFSILFQGDCICKMLVYKIIHSTKEGTEDVIDKITKSKYRRIYEYIKYNKAQDDTLDSQRIEDKMLEKVLIDILFIRNIQGRKVEGINLKEKKDIKLIKEEDIKKKEEDIKKKEEDAKKEEENINKIEVKPTTKEEIKVKKGEVKNIVKKKMVFKKKEPSVNYLNIKWTKINKKDTLFESMDLDYYKEKFSENDLKYFIKVPEVKKAFKEIKREVLMDPKKSYALNIALSRIKCDYKEVVYGILNHDSKLLNDNLINQLLLYFPTDQEVSNILASSSKDKYVLFFKECGDCIQDVRNNLKSIKLDFLIENCNINYIQIFNKFFIEVLNSRFLEELLGCVLYIGNIVNKGTTYGGAEGFSISDIPGILNMRLNNQESYSKLHNTIKIEDMKIQKKGNVQTVKDLIKSRIPSNDVNTSSDSGLSVRNISYDNLLNEIREIINIKRDILLPHKKYEEMHTVYQELVDLSEKIKKRFSLDRVNDEVIRLIIELCDIQDKHK